MSDQAVLLLVDFQRGVCEQPALADRVATSGVLSQAKRCLDAARRASVPPIHVRVAFEPNYGRRTNTSARFDQHEANGRFLVGTRETEFCSEVLPLPEEIVLDKGGVDPLVGTGLVEILVRSGRTSVFVCGVATNYAVESAARHGCDLGLSMTVVSDACTSFSDEMHDFSIQQMLPAFADVCTAEEFVAALDH